MQHLDELTAEQSVSGACPSSKRRVGGVSVRRAVVVGLAGLALLVGPVGVTRAGAAVATTAPYTTADGNYGAGFGLGQTTIKCFPDRHQAYFSVSMSDAYGVYDTTGETVQFSIAAYKWNAAKGQFLYNSTTGWIQGTTRGSTQAWNWWSGAQSGFWRHLITYRWMVSNGTWVTGSEWMGATTETLYQQMTSTVYGYETGSSYYCTT
jgi:hypothetical protein